MPVSRKAVKSSENVVLTLKGCSVIQTRVDNGRSTFDTNICKATLDGAEIIYNVNTSVIEIESLI